MLGAATLVTLGLAVGGVRQAEPADASTIGCGTGLAGMALGAAGALNPWGAGSLYMSYVGAVDSCSSLTGMNLAPRDTTMNPVTHSIGGSAYAMELAMIK